MKARDPGPQDPRIGTLGLRTRNPVPQDPGRKNQNHKIRDPETLNFFIELQNKTLKIKKPLASKRDNAKDPF